VRSLALLVAASCTDLGGAPPDAADAGVDVDPCAAEAGTGPMDAGLDGPSYRIDVESIFTRKCAMGGCHGTSNPALGMVLAEDVSWSHLVCVPSAAAPSLRRVVPSQPERSYLVNKLDGTHLDVGGMGRRMPLGQEPLSVLEMDLITGWIRAGARNN